MSDDSDDDIDKLAKQEIAKLKRQYRHVEAERKYFCHKSENKLRKQKAVLKDLREEKNDLKLNLMVAQSRQNVMKDQMNLEELTNLLQEQEYFKNLIHEEKAAIKVLDEEVARLENEILEQNKLIKGMSGTEQAIKVEKQIRTLENRLEKATVDFDKTLTKNKKLKDEIDDLRIQRSTYDEIYKKLTRKLNDQKKLMNQIIEQSTLAYDQRDEAEAKIQMLREKNEKDLATYNYEYRELMRIIDHDAKLKSFINVKAMERNDTVERKDDMTNKKTGDTDKAEQSAKEMIETYERSFKIIKEITGEQDVQVLVKKFTETEEKNYALFTYINEINNELRIVEDQIEKTRQQIRDYNENGVLFQTEKHEELQMLEKKLADAKKDEEKFNVQLAETDRVLDQLKEGIGSVFDEINCDKSLLTQELGENDKVTDENILKYLTMIEQKTNQLLQVHAYLQLKELEQKAMENNEIGMAQTAILGGPSAPTQNEPVQIVVPACDDEKKEENEHEKELQAEEASEEIDTPLSPDELKKQATKNAVKLEQGTS